MPTVKQIRKPPAPKAEAKPARPVLYPEFMVQVARGEDAVTFERAKELLGWEDLPAKDTGAVPELYQLLKKYVRLNHNTKNREIVLPWLRTLKQVILRRHWRFNGEPIQIGTTGLVISGQHRLLAFIFAVLEWLDGPQKYYWREGPSQWGDTPPTLETVVEYGVDESDDVFKTINQGRPASTADILYRSDLFRDAKPRDRSTLAKMTDNATKLLWSRLGSAGKENAHAKSRTPGEVVDFLSRHGGMGGRLLQAVKHVFEENQKPKREAKVNSRTGKKVKDNSPPPPEPIGQYVRPGTAAGLLYLMASSKTDGDLYRDADPPREEVLNFDLWDRACEFWVELGAGASAMKEVRYAIGALYGVNGSNYVTPAEKEAVIAKAWGVYSEGHSPTREDLALRFKLLKDDDGNITGRTLIDPPGFGGIDCGTEPDKDGEEAEEESSGEATEVPEEELERRREQTRVEKEKKAKKDKALRDAVERKKAKAAAKNAPKEGDVEGLTEAGKKAQAEQIASQNESTSENGVMVADGVAGVCKRCKSQVEVKNGVLSPHIHLKKKVRCGGSGEKAASYLIPSGQPEVSRV